MESMQLYRIYVGQKLEDCPVELCATSYHDNESMWFHLTVYVEKGQEHLSFGFLVGWAFQWIMQLLPCTRMNTCLCVYLTDYYHYSHL